MNSLTAIVLSLILLAPILVFAANPPAPFTPSQNIQDPGAASAPGTGGTGCGPLDSNCYINLSGSFSAVTVAGNTAVGTGAGTVNSFGTGAASVNTFGSTAGTNTIAGATTFTQAVTFTVAPSLPLTLGALFVGNGSSIAAPLAVGTAGQVLTVVGGVPAWAATPTEVDGIIGNEVTNATASGGLTRSGTGTLLDPYTLGISTGGVVTAMLADNSVTSAKIVDGTIASADLAANSVDSSKVVDGTIINADIANGTIELTAKVTGTLPIINGGTGSSTQNWVDLTTNQTAIAGAKTFTGTHTITTSGNVLSLTTSSGSTQSIATLANSTGNFGIFQGIATPEAAVTGDIGDLYVDTVSGKMYQKVSGTATTTGWIAFGATGADSTTASSGLSLVSGDVRLGGTLVAAASIANAGFALNITGTGATNIAATGQATIAGNLDATNGVDVTGGNLTVGGVNFSVAQATGNTTVGGVLTVNGNQTNAGDLAVNGNIALGNATSDTTTINGTTSIASGTGTALTLTRTAAGQWLAFSDGTDTFGIYNRAGTPEGNIAANIGSMAMDTNTGTLYTKTADTVNTGWVAVGSGGSTLYTANGNLTSARTITSSGFSITYDGTGDISFADSGLLTTVGLTSTGANTFSGTTSVSGTNTFTVGTGATALGGTLAVTGNQTNVGDLAVNGGDITTTATTLNLDVGNTGTFNFRDGTNTLLSVVDSGAVGNVTASGTLTSSGVFTASSSAIISGSALLNGLSTFIGDASTDRLVITSQILNSSALVFQGATDDVFTTSFAITDPTASRTITFPNLSGTVSLLDQTVESGEVTDDTLVNTDINSAAAIALSKLASGSSIITSLATPTGTNANGGSITSNVLTLALADATNPGLLSAGAQTIAGAKTFSAVVTGLTFVPTGATAPTNGLFLPATNQIGLGTNSTERFRIDSSGNVGIGDTSPDFKT